jgi:nitroreductase
MRADAGAWSVTGDDSPGATLRSCLEAAIAAPSIHNTQPWRFRLRDNGIDLLVDRERRLDVIDPHGRALFMSVGAALLNLRVAMLAHGRTPMIRLLPSRVDADAVARVTVGVPVRVTETARLLCQAIPRRHTNRRPFADITIPGEVRGELVDAASAEGATLTILDRPACQNVLAVVRTAENRWRHDPAYWGELARWTRQVPGRRDGVPTEAFGPWSAQEAVPLRDFGLVQPIPHRWTVPFERDPVLAMLYTTGDGRREWLRAGQAMQRTLLTAAVRGLASSLMTQPLELPELRALLAEDGARLPQEIIRFGYGRPSAASPRRALDDVLLVDGHAPAVGEPEPARQPAAAHQSAER